MKAWEQHIELRGDPALTGAWEDGTPWAFYSYDQVLPDGLPVITSMCVPVCSLDLLNPQVMFTLNLGRGGFEIPGGHGEQLENGEMETLPAAALRERGEETGLHTATKPLIPYGYSEAINAPGSVYPPLSYMQFLVAYTPDNPGLITDPEVDGAGVFTLDASRRMAERGLIKVSELGLACLGVRALFRYYGLPNEHIRMP